jgi:hypothetical protein
MSTVVTQPAVGFTWNATTYEKMQRTDTTARILNDDVRMYVTRESFKTAFAQWYAKWRAFFDKTMDEKWSNVLRSDAIAEQAAAYEQDLVRWQDGYAAERDAQGKPLPSNAPKLQVTPPPPDGEKKDEGLPLWVFIAGVGLVAAGVFAYFAVKRMQQVRNNIEKDVLPLVMGASMGPTGVALAKAAAHDPDCGGCGRDLDIKPASPRVGAKYILSGY